MRTCGRARAPLPSPPGGTYVTGRVNLSHLRARRRRSKALDPTKHFVVTFALFCNGEVSGAAAGAAVERVGGALTFGRVFFPRRLCALPSPPPLSYPRCPVGIVWGDVRGIDSRLRRQTRCVTSWGLREGGRAARRGCGHCRRRRRLPSQAAPGLTPR